MAIIKTQLGRRSFIKSSAMVGGGMVLSFSWLASCNSEAGRQAALSMPDEWFEINGFLKIGENGRVTIMSPNPEIGQNIKTAMPMIVAEELDTDWEQVIVEQAPLNTDIFTRQLAGGSQSIRQSWPALRMAGATARQMLKAAAALAWQVPVAEITTAMGVLYHKASNRSGGYGEFAAAAAALPVPEEVTLKTPQEFSIVGTDRKNVDGSKIVSGQPLFGLDIRKDGMLYAMVVHPPAFGLKLSAADVSAVKKMPGIVDAFPIVVYPEGVQRQWSDGGAIDEMVAVIGKSTWECMQARKVLEAQWEVSGALESTSDHEAALHELLHSKFEKPARQDGDVISAFKRADKIVESTYSAPYLAHNPMEPMNFFAHVTDDKAELLGPIQTPEFLENTLAEVLKMPKENIEIGMTRMGGGFGRRLYGTFAVEAARISQELKAPVLLVYSREDDMTQGTYRPSYKVQYKAGLDAQGNLIAFHVKGVGTNDALVFENRFPAGTVDNYLAEKASLPTQVTTGAWRAPASNFIAGAEQAFLDEVAEAAGKDPIEFRLELFERAISNPVGDPAKNDYDAERYAGVLRLIRDKANWHMEPAAGVSRGVSAYFCHNSYAAQVVDVVMENNRPRVKKVWCAVDCGIVINPLSAKNQIEGGIVDGIGHASYSALTFTEGKPDQTNYDKYQLIRHHQAPEEIETFFAENDIDPTGLGEPSLPPVSGALANALYRATGNRYYSQPFFGNNRQVVG